MAAPRFLLARSAIASIAVSVALASGAPAPAAPAAEPVEALEEGWHRIRPGDTLEGLATQFLGDARRWPELHALNPRILDPHWIFPGRKVRIPLTRPAATPNAQVVVVSNRVETLPAPIDWATADAGDLLLERDGLRTHERSTARLVFDDGSTANVAESSLVFIRRQTPATAPVPRKEIEIEAGQAELATAAGTPTPPEIEVVVGATRTATRASAGGVARSRHRLAGESAQVMLYDGQGEVSAGGGRVELAAGTGTSVAPGAAPRPPERLLAAPELVSPPDGAELAANVRELVLEWREVPQAAGYLLELCGDRRCGAVVERVGGLRTTKHRLPAPARSALYWRVTAVAASGLDGFPSPARGVRPPLLVVFE
jgi:hypothetical protein